MQPGKGRILYVVSNFPCYSETFILNELVELRARGRDIHIFALRNPRECVVQEQAKEFIPQTLYSPLLLNVNLFKAQGYFIVKKPAVYFGLIWLIISRCWHSPTTLLKSLGIVPLSVHCAWNKRHENIGHVHAHFAHYPATTALVVAKLLDVPFSFTCHAHDIFYDATFLDTKVKECKACFAISEYNKRYIQETFPSIDQEKIKVLHCGIDLEKFQKEFGRGYNDITNILSVGRLMPTKGFDDLIRACILLKERGTRFSCTIVGEGPMEETLRALSCQGGVQEEVTFVGPKSSDEVISLLKQTDVFVLASKRAQHRDVQDGIPVVLMEAMASRVAVISTRVSGIPELVVDHDNGMTVEPGDYQGLAERLQQLCMQEPLRTRFVERGYQTVSESFNIKTNVDVLERVFDA